MAPVRSVTINKKVQAERQGLAPGAEGGPGCADTARNGHSSFSEC